MNISTFQQLIKSHGGVTVGDNEVVFQVSSPPHILMLVMTEAQVVVVVVHWLAVSGVPP